VYVVGIALEFCVLATCRDAIWYGKTVVAVEPYIRSATRDPVEQEYMWQLLTSLGVVRAQNVALTVNL
jgi:nicotinamidase-related amidase